MSYVLRTTSARPFLAAASLAAALMATPLLAYSQESSGSRENTGAMADHAAKADAKAQSIDERITTLHTELKITPAEETAWSAVAQTMRDNAAAMEKMAQDKADQSQKGMTAVEDLQTYEQFAQAHVDHLKQLTDKFEALYNAMPASQKKLADEVFSRSHRSEQANQG